MTESAVRILVVDGEPFLADLVATTLRYEGFATATAGSGSEARTEAARFRPDLIILDVLLPDGSGIDVCRRLRHDGLSCPVVFLTARDSAEAGTAGLTVGGDDYLTKPFSLDELAARIHAVLRRAGSGRVPALLVVGDLEIDDDAHEVRRGGRTLDLTPTEFTLLRYLAANAGRVLSRRRILEHVWEYDFGGGSGVVHTYISYLRRKIDAGGPSLIRTVPRVGYVLRAVGDGEATR